MPQFGSFTLSAPVSVHNLTAWFMLAPSPTPSGVPAGVPEYRVLEESMDDAVAVLHETGNVNSLLIENTGDLDLFIQAGDIVRGGRQDRALSADFIVPARSGAIPLPAFCVESARWHKRGMEDASRFSKSKHGLSSKKAKLAMLFKKSQSEVWRGVADEQLALAECLGVDASSESSPTSLELTYELHHVQRAVEDYLEPLEKGFLEAGGEVLGVVWAIDGRPSHADCYVTPGLFEKCWQKLLRAAAIESLMAKSLPRSQADAVGRAEPVEGAGVPSSEEILGWLTKAWEESPSAPSAAVRGTGGGEEESLPPRTRLRRRQGASAHLVECFDTAVAGGTPVHIMLLAP